MSMRCLLIRDEFVEEAWTWTSLISDVANKAGVHVDDERPVSWDQVGQYDAGEVPQMAQLVYRLALVVLRCGNEVLASLGRDRVEVDDLSPALGGMLVSQVSVRENLP
jgi:hypothetical protein